jgi:hypothetical protein
LAFLDPNPTVDIGDAMGAYEDELNKGGRVERIPVVGPHGGPTGQFVEQFAPWPLDYYEQRRQNYMRFQRYLGTGGLRIQAADNAELNRQFTEEVAHGDAILEDSKALAKEGARGELSAPEFARRAAEIRRRRDGLRPGGPEGDAPPWSASVDSLAARIERHETIREEDPSGYYTMVNALLSNRRGNARAFATELQTGRFEDIQFSPKFETPHVTDLPVLKDQTLKEIGKLDAILKQLHERDELRARYDGPTDKQRQDLPAINTRYPRGG